MYKDGRDVDAIGAWHAVLAVVAGDCLQCYQLVGDGFKKCVFLGRDGAQWRIGFYIFHEVIHISHATEHSKHTVGSAGIAESPRCHATLRVATLHVGHDGIGHVSQSSTQQWLHDDSRYVTLLEFGIEIFGISVALIDFLGMLPVEVV